MCGSMDQDATWYGEPFYKRSPKNYWQSQMEYNIHIEKSPNKSSAVAEMVDRLATIDN